MQRFDIPVLYYCESCPGDGDYAYERGCDFCVRADESALVTVLLLKILERLTDDSPDTDSGDASDADSRSGGSATDDEHSTVSDTEG